MVAIAHELELGNWLNPSTRPYQPTAVNRFNNPAAYGQSLLGVLDGWQDVDGVVVPLFGGLEVR